MNKASQPNRQLILWGIPFLTILFLILLAKSLVFTSNSSTFSFAITLDLLLTVPIIYYLLIRKTKIPKTTIVPVLIVGLVVGTYILPVENQYYLNLFKTWGLPVIEISALAFIVIKVHASLKKYKERKEVNPDFFTALIETCAEVLPEKAVLPFATEIAVFYYGFINWKKLVPMKNEFTYHKNSGTVALLIAIIFIVGIEASVIHILLLKWSSTTAWIMTVLSIYTAIQLFGFLKSITKRPILISGNKLYLRYGILNEANVDLENIESVELTTKSIEFNKETRKLSPFGDLESHNVIINLNKENVLSGLYGTRKKFTTLALYVDNKEEFKNKIDTVLKQKTNL